MDLGILPFLTLPVLGVLLAIVSLAGRNALREDDPKMRLLVIAGRVIAVLMLGAVAAAFWLGWGSFKGIAGAFQLAALVLLAFTCLSSAWSAKIRGVLIPATLLVVLASYALSGFQLGGWRRAGIVAASVVGGCVVGLLIRWASKGLKSHRSAARGRKATSGEPTS